MIPTYDILHPLSADRLTVNDVVDVIVPETLKERADPVGVYAK